MSLIQKVKCYFGYHDLDLKKQEELRPIFDGDQEIDRCTIFRWVWFCKYCNKERKEHE